MIRTYKFVLSLLGRYINHCAADATALKVQYLPMRILGVAQLSAILPLNITNQVLIPHIEKRRQKKKRPKKKIYDF